MLHREESMKVKQAGDINQPPTLTYSTVLVDSVIHTI